MKGFCVVYIVTSVYTLLMPILGVHKSLKQVIFMTDTSFDEKPYDSANELWEALSPTKSFFKEPYKLIYRGQADSNWSLLPSLLRNENTSILLKTRGVRSKADDLIFTEIRLLELFTEHCDKIGVRVPNDSVKFRSDVLNSQAQGKYYIKPELWPNPPPVSGLLSPLKIIH